MPILRLENEPLSSDTVPYAKIFEMNKKKKGLKAEINKELIEAFKGTITLPFPAGNDKSIAVKIVDDRGVESLKVVILF